MRYADQPHNFFITAAQDRSQREHSNRGVVTGVVGTRAALSQSSVIAGQN